MKNKIYFGFVIALNSFLIFGCTGFIPSKVVTFSFEEWYNSFGTASIYFIGQDKTGIRLVDCDDRTMPPAAGGTRWDSAIEFPSDVDLNLRVYIYWNEDRFGERRRGIFKCPPLESGKKYKLWFRGDDKGGKIYLTYAESLSATSSVVHEQEVPPGP